ncbi:response regulator [Phenylobacterium montanum]|uniref:Response regulator n=1 Tax=Phenylobacterium montanum TaxID=2823693 RepID=A0A975G008_9CAUL|nr:response regulator [Caulobacter sp. S6]QUD88279.1 response regulator [Caulobacter sp. S6]
MSALSQLAQHLPFLRRYARALTGDQVTGDNYVRAALEVIAGQGLPEAPGYTPRIALYRTFHVIWTSSGAQLEQRAAAIDTEISAQERLMHVGAQSREAFLLTAMEGFRADEAALVLGVEEAEVAALAAAVQAEADALFSREVLIIEDEPIICADLEGILEELGHKVSGVAATRAEAVASAKQKRPGLILSDIQLADGSSGADAVQDILKLWDVPVVLITAFPERLLTGERPEPTFLVTKPFRPEAVKAAITQALFMHKSPTRRAA